MAEQEKQGDKAAEEEQGKGKPRGPLKLMVGVVLMIATGGALAIMAVPGKEKVYRFEGPYFGNLLEGVIVSTPDGNITRYLKFDVDVEYVAYDEDYFQMRVDDPFYTSYQFADLPAGATSVVSVEIFVEHYEEEGFTTNKLEWQIGTGWQAGSPTVWAQNTSVPIRQDEQNEATDSWNVSSTVTTVSKLNDLEFVVKNNDNEEELKTFSNYVYVVVTYE